MPMFARVLGDTAMPFRTPLVALNAPSVQSATFIFSPTVFNGTSIGTLMVVGATPITWAITAGNGGGNFAINSSTGLITAAADISTPQTFSLTIQATNIVGIGTATATVKILAPPVVQSATFNKPTPVGNGATIGTMTVTQGATPITWAITAGNDAGNFAINSTTGQITAAANILAQNFSLTVQATNIVGSATGTATINILDPPVVQGATFTFNDPVPAGTVVGTLALTSGTTPVTWAITAGNNLGVYAIDPNTGQITLALGNDAVTTNHLTVQATNAAASGTGIATVTYLYSVLSVGLSTSTVNLPAMNAGDFVSHVVVTTDPGGGVPNTPITMTGPDAGLFVLTNGGVFPCDVNVGASNIPAGSYHITLTAS